MKPAANDGFGAQREEPHATAESVERFGLLYRLIKSGAIDRFSITPETFAGMDLQTMRKYVEKTIRRTREWKRNLPDENRR